MSPEARGVRNGAGGLLLAAFLVALSLRPASAAPPAQSVVDGQAIFQAQCAGCHTVGGGPLIGPDLKGVTQLRDRQWLVAFIGEPDKVLASGDPIATALVQQFNNVRMPNLGLSQAQVDAVITYLQTQAGGTSEPTPAPVPATSQPAGDPKRGEALFMGTADFQAGGPPCMGCHSIDRLGALGGGVMGPNLTQAFSRYGDAGLASALANIPFPTMKPIFAAHPLTPEEQADLYAFLQAEVGQPEANAEVLVLVLSIAGFLVAMGAIWFIWRHRLLRVRRTLVERGAPGATNSAARVTKRS